MGNEADDWDQAVAKQSDWRWGAQRLRLFSAYFLKTIGRADSLWCL